MIHLNIDPDKVNAWLLNLVLSGFFLFEISVVGYIVYLIVHRIPH
jgi:hypothetical protein